MRLVIVDDHRLLVDALAHALTDLGHQVRTADAGVETTLAAVRSLRPDVCLVDVTGTGQDDLDLITTVLSASPRTRVVLMANRVDHRTVARALLDGASGFVSKQQSIGEIVEVLEHAHAGRVALAPPLLRGALRSVRDRDEELWQLRFLTDREWEVLRCLVDGLTTEEMSRALGVRRSTARTHVQNLLTKLGVHSRLKAAALISNHVPAHEWPAHVRSRPVTTAPVPVPRPRAALGLIGPDPAPGLAPDLEEGSVAAS